MKSNDIICFSQENVLLAELMHNLYVCVLVVQEKEKKTIYNKIYLPSDSMLFKKFILRYPPATFRILPRTPYLLLPRPFSQSAFHRPDPLVKRRRRPKRTFLKPRCCFPQILKCVATVRQDAYQDLCSHTAFVLLHQAHRSAYKDVANFAGVDDNSRTRNK